VDAETDRILETVAAEAARCGDIVRNLLVFSRTSSARFVEEELGPILERCGFLLRHQAELQGVELACEAPQGLRITCDAAQIQQLLLALALNALEATPSGGTVRLATRAAGDGRVELVVSDTGSGIPSENLPHIFEPFFTTKEEGKGVGLGLAVAYGIAVRHGGTIAVESRVGQGTTFTVRLPWRPPEGAGAEAADAVEGAQQTP
jgi:two-component system NtrC family sensor kinase